MKRSTIVMALGTLAAASVIAVAGMPAASVQALPDYNSLCSSCHIADTQVKATVSQANATTWNFTITGPYSGQSGYGVFDSTGTKVASGYGTSGSFTITNPSGTYRFFGVNKDPNSYNGYSLVQFSVAAQPTATPTNTTTPPTATPTASPAAPTATPTGPTATPTGPTATPTKAAASPTPPPASTPQPSTSTGPGAVIGTKHDLGSPGNPACNKCHTPHDASGNYLWARSVGSGTGIEPLCYSCHDGSVTNVGKFAFDASLAQHPTTPGTPGADCDRCHDPHVGTFKFTILSQTNADLCQSCHGKTGHENHPVDVVDSDAIPTDGAWDPNATPPDFSGTRLYDASGTTQVTSGSGSVKCMTCHTPHGGTPGTSLNTMATSSATNSTSPLCQNCHK